MASSEQTPKEAARKRRLLGFLEWSEIPLKVYAAIFITMALLWIFQAVHPDVTLGFFTELMGAAFTLFIVDTLLVRAKTKRWKVVRGQVDYLIARNINRLRDGISVRALGFTPDIPDGLPEAVQYNAVREQRALFLEEMETLEPEQLIPLIPEAAFFTGETYDYLDDKAEDLWEILNMKYSEYLDPELVAALMRLHTHIRNTCGHIRQFGKADRFPEDADYYRRTGRMGAGVSLHEIVAGANALKRQGYSEAADLTETAPSRDL